MQAVCICLLGLFAPLLWNGAAGVRPAAARTQAAPLQQARLRSLTRPVAPLQLPESKAWLARQDLAAAASRCIAEATFASPLVEARMDSMLRHASRSAAAAAAVR